MTLAATPADARLPSTGRALAEALASRHPSEDWIAALAKGAVMPRAEVMAALESEGAVPPALVQAAADLPGLLAPPVLDAGDHVFAAQTNDDAAAIEVDAEAGLKSLPGAKEHPSKSGTPFEAGPGRSDAAKDV